MAESEAPVRCPRGHLTAAGYQFCTTCGERVAPEPDVAGPVASPPPLDDDEGSVGFALPPDLADVSPPPAAGGDLAAGSKRRRLRGGIGRLRRKPTERDAPIGPSLLVTDADQADAELIENEPPMIDPPEVEPPPLGRPSASTVYGDVEFAIGPGTRRAVTYGLPEPVRAPPETAAKSRFAGATSRIPDGIPTRLLVAVLVLVAAVAAAIVLFVIRDPGAPAATLTAIPTVQPSAVQSSAASAVPATTTVSEQCANSFAFAAAHAADAQAPVFQQSTLGFCTTSDEWLAAARLNPTAIGVTDPSEVGDDDLARVCAGAPGTGVCTTLTPPPSATSPAAASPLPSP